MLAQLVPGWLSARVAPEAHTATHAEHASTPYGARTRVMRQLRDEKLMYSGKGSQSPRLAPRAVDL